MKVAIYKRLDGKDLRIEYDEKASCRICGLPVEHASIGGTDVCPACDCGRYRDNTEINLRELMRPDLLKRKAKEIYEKILEDKKNDRRKDRTKL